jgi:hypothetical protein
MTKGVFLCHLNFEVKPVENSAGKTGGGNPLASTHVTRTSPRLLA